MEGNYWKRRLLGALHLNHQQYTSNVDCSLPGLPLLDNLYALHYLSDLSKFALLDSLFHLTHLILIVSFTACQLLTAFNTTRYYLKVKYCKVS